MKPQIALIAPYNSLFLEAQAVATRLGQDVRVIEGDLEEGVKAARQAVGQGAEVLVSRGGTARLIARNVDAPVVEIRVCPQDILRCLRLLKGAPGPIGIVGFGNVIADCETLGDLLDIPLQFIEVQSQEDARIKITEAAGKGLRTLIGDAVSVKQALALGLMGAFIDSGKEAISKAIAEARTVAAVRIRERERSELLRVVVESSHDGIVAIGPDERIILYNPAAEKIFSIPAVEALGTPVTQVIPNTELPRVLRKGDSELNELQQIGDKYIVTHRHAVTVASRTVAAIANCQDVTDLQRLEQIVRQKLHAKRLIAKTILEDLLGESPVIAHLKNRARKFAAVKAAVLICGQTGTGKEMLAQSIHNLSPRAHGPFVAVNCAALPENLLESELFGYEEGAFTGAKKGGKLGLFELAHGGSIFLDEIGEIPLKLQSRLLRVLQEHEVLRVGGSRIIPIDVRIIAATNCNLPSRMAQGHFRSDLYHRLAVLKLTVPPLAERRQDIPLLVTHFLRTNRSLNPGVHGMDAHAQELLGKYRWPGNVRELEHAIERLLILAEGRTIGADAVEDLLREMEEDNCLEGANCPQEMPAAGSKTRLADIEGHVIATVLEQAGHNKTLAAKRLGIDRSTLRRKLRELGHPQNAR
ncbi:MAG: sigma 54-interacting transcriptional regulator [Solidesulfovibrio sp.]